MAGDDRGRQRVQSQLLKKLKGVSLEAEEAKKEDGVAGEEISPALGDLLDNLKIEKSRPRVKIQGQQGMSRGKADDEEEDGVGREKAWKRRDAENVRWESDMTRSSADPWKLTILLTRIIPQVQTRSSEGAHNGAACLFAKTSKTSKTGGGEERNPRTNRSLWRNSFWNFGSSRPGRRNC